MRHGLLLALSLWMFLLAPAFCVAGVMLHPCPDAEGEEYCTHESFCEGDPCADTVTVPSGISIVLSVPTLEAETVPVLVPMPAETAAPVRPVAIAASGPLRPYPPSDLPLLN